jgi:CHAT domain
MSQFDFGPLGTFRTCAASERADRVARELEAYFAPYLVIRRDLEDRNGWYVFLVDEELIRRLKSKRFGITVEHTLDLHEHEFDTPRIVSMEGPPGTLLTRVLASHVRAAAHRPHVLLDTHEAVRGIFTGEALPPAQAMLYPSITCVDGNEVEPGQVVEFLVKVEAAPQPGITTALPIQFPRHAETIDLYAEVSSREFGPLGRDEWSKTFVVSRQLRSTPDQWLFKARARGNRKQYSLTVTFHTAGAVVGALGVTLPRRSRLASAPPPKFSARLMSIPQESGARLVVSISEQGGQDYLLSLYQDNGQWDDAVPWQGAGRASETYFTWLENAQTDQDLQDAGYGLWVDLPEPMRRFLDRHEVEGASTLFISNGRVAPFEILQLRPKSSGPFLGVDRPVTRWVNDSGMPAGRELKVARVACIRPTYQGADALPSAVAEEAYLQGRFPRLSHVATKSDLDTLLDNGDVGLVHFAGHADGNPAQLTLEDARVPPARFHPAKPLLSQGHPLFFLNGCRAGSGRSGAPAAVANFVKVLLTSECSAVVAPMIKTDSAAALEAAHVFYEALETESIAEAVRRVRALPTTRAMPDAQRATFLSYLAFAPPTLRVAFT